ncbi:hypothetical protein, partial [Nitratireductor soli]|uniref:hypothetical protein n=1 Tax=Nitratireductor soli TaxID=1670619 RepID=UPI0019D2D567
QRQNRQPVEAPVRLLVTGIGIVAGNAWLHQRAAERNPLTTVFPVLLLAHERETSTCGKNIPHTAVNY